MIVIISVESIDFDSIKKTFYRNLPFKTKRHDQQKKKTSFYLCNNVTVLKSLEEERNVSIFFSVFSYFSDFILNHTHTHTHTYIYIYIYIYNLKYQKATLLSTTNDFHVRSSDG